MRRAASILLPLLLTAFFLAACGKDKPPGPDTTPPAAVTDLTLLRTTETSATLMWTAPGDDGDRGQARAYNLRYSLTPLPAGWDSAGEARHLAVPSLAGRADSATVGGLLRDRIYYFALRTMDDAGNFSSLSNVVQAQTADPTPPGRVTDLRGVLLEPRAVTLQFTSPGDDGYVGTASSFEVRYGPGPVTEETWESATAYPVPTIPSPAGYQERVRIAGFEPEATVHFALRARDDGGQWSAVSNDLDVTFPVDTVPPAAIGDLAVGGIVPFEVTLSWTAPGNDGSEGRASAYAVRYAEAAITGESWESATAVPVSLSPKEAGAREEVTVTDLPGGGDLWFSVRAVDERTNRGPVSNAAKGFVRSTPQTWVVRVDGSGDAPTVQAGIDSSRHGDTVLVEPGTYYENVDYLGKEVVLRSIDGPEVTVLDGSLRDSSVVVIRGGETRAAVLEGFTIRGGRGVAMLGGRHFGGGIFCLNSDPSILGNLIEGNTIYGGGWGAGMYVGTYPSHLPLASPLIKGNTFRRNVSGQNGGGLGIENSLTEVIENEFRDNSCRADGAGIWVWMRYGQVIIKGNRLWENVAGDHGGGIYAARTGGKDEGGPYTLERNLLVRNRTVGTGFFGDTGSGGAIAALKMSGLIRYNTMVGNDGQHLTSCGGGGLLLYVTDEDLTVHGNIIANNDECGISCWWDGTTATMGPNLVWGNGGGDFGTGSGECPGNWADVLLFADPLFCDPDNDDYRVASNSPAMTGEEVMGAYCEPGCGPRRPIPSIAWKRLETPYPD